MRLHLTIVFLLYHHSNYDYIVHQNLGSAFFTTFFTNLIIALASTLPLALVLASTFPVAVGFTFIICSSLFSNYTLSYTVVALCIVIFFIIQFYLVNLYREIHKHLSQYSSKDYKFLVLMGASSLGLFLGWLTYQFFPIFANR